MRKIAIQMKSESTDSKQDSFAFGESIDLRKEFRRTDPDRKRRCRLVLLPPLVYVLVFVIFLVDFLISSNPLAELVSIYRDGPRLRSVVELVLFAFFVIIVILASALCCYALYISGLLPLDAFTEILHPDSVERVRLHRSAVFLFSSYNLRTVHDKRFGVYSVFLESPTGQTLSLPNLTSAEMSAVVAQYHRSSKVPESRADQSSPSTT
jgi:hypothetical protein